MAGQLSANLSAAANGLAAQTPQAAVATEAAALALEAGVEANTVTLAASLLSGLPDRAALTSGSAQVYGFQLQVLHLNGSTTPQTFSGVLVFEGASNWILVAGPSPGAPFPSALGILASGAQIWMATAGQESAQLQAEGSACTPPVPLPPEVTSCKLATFTQAGFSITSSAPHSGAATGSRTASLTTQNLGGGVSLIIDCSKGTLCPGSGTGGGVHVSVSPPSIGLAAGATQNFSATVTGSSDTAVVWSVDEASGGTIDAASGHYVAPLNAGAFHVRATSHADTTKYGEATVVVNAPGVTVTVTPNPASVGTDGKQQFNSQVTGTSNTAVSWSVEEPVGGTIGTGGLYTAPASSGTFHVRATSVANPAAFGRAQVFVSPTPQIIVTVIPSVATVQGGKQQSFGAGVTGTSNVAVTWTVDESGGGTIDTDGLYTAPMVSAAQTYHVRATSQADTTKFGEATVSVTPQPSISISPKNPQTTTLAKTPFTVSVVGLSSGAVTWSIVEDTGIGYPGGTIDSSGNYTAPATPGTFHVKAVSQVDGTTSDVSTVTVNPGCMIALPPVMKIGSQSTMAMVGRVPVRVDSQGRPVVAWLEYGPYITYVARYENGAWGLLGASGLPSGGFGGVLRVDLAIDSHDHPVVAYETYPNPGAQPEVHVATWSDTTGWNALSAAVPQGSQNNGFALALGPGDVPMVAISRSLVGNPGFDIAVATWNGASWSMAGGIYGTAGHPVFNPDIVVDKAGNVTVAWDEQLPPAGCCATFKPFAKKLNGPGAGLLGSPSTADIYYIGGPSLAFDGSGNLAMAWSNYVPATTGGFSTGLEVSLSGAGGSWSQLGNSLPELTDVVVPEHSGSPYNPHVMVRDLDTGMLAATTDFTDNDIAGVYEYSNTGASAGTWPMVCAPMPDVRQFDDMATGNSVAGLAYDTVNHGFVFAAMPEGGDRVFVARVSH